MAIAFSILCALVYGASDFCGGLASKRTATTGVVALSQLAGFVLLVGIAPFVGGAPIAGDWIWAAVSGLAAAGALMLLYRGLAIGTMGIVSPVTAVLAASVPVIFGVAVRGDRPAWLAVAGIVAALIAVVCVSASPDVDFPARSTARAAFALPPGVLEAMGAGVCFGAIFITLAQVRSEAGLYPLLLARFATFALIALAAALGGRAGDLRVTRAAIGIVLACGALDLSANVAYLFAIHGGGMLSLVAVISSLYPASTVALAAIVLGERLVTIQWIGVALALGGVAAISFAR